MHILGIETSTKTGSIAIVSDTNVIAHYALNLETTHSERLMATLDRVFSDTGMNVAQMDGFAVSIGPGSFTGLRIGISAIKGLALATGKPVAAVPTLRALAGNVPCPAAPVCPLLVARKNEVYAALYAAENNALIQLRQESVMPLAGLADFINGKTIFVGEAASLHRVEIERALGGSAVFAPKSAHLPSAAVVAELGLDMIAAGQGADAENLVPLYISRPEAEVAWEKRLQSQ